MTSTTENEAPLRGPRRVAVDDERPIRTRPARSLRQRVRMPLMLAGPLVVALAASWWYLTTGRFVSTDDAYIQAARVQISNDVSGRVTAIDVHDNERVTKGQVLFRIDPRPFEIAVEEAKAQLAAARLQIHALKSTYKQKIADAQASQENLTYQEREYERQKQLVGSGVATRQQFDQQTMNLDVGRQKLASAQHDVGTILAQLGGDPGIDVDTHPTVQRALAALDKAQLDLSYTVVRAPEDGIVTKVDQLQVGNWVQGVNTGAPPTPLFSLVSTHRIWVEANFKETELTNMRPGQDATVEVDTHYRRPWLVWLQRSFSRVFGTAEASEAGH